MSSRTVKDCILIHVYLKCNSRKQAKMQTGEFDIHIIGTEEISQEENNLSLEELLALPHPLEQHPELVQLVEKLFPEKNYSKLLLEATKPEISNSPDELELWESEVILKRKQKLPNDFGLAHLIRILYEETFSVRQFQDTKLGSEGPTPGGLLSHHVLFGRVDEVSVESIQEIEILENTFEAEFQRLVAANDYATLRIFTTLVTEMAFPSNYFIPGHAHRMREMMLRKKQYIHSDYLETYGFRTVKMMSLHPEFIAEVVDQSLLEICNFNKPEPFVFLLRRLWGILGITPGPFFAEGGFYKTIENQELITALEKLIQFRIHPQTQLLYKYISPSGYINQQKLK